MIAKLVAILSSYGFNPVEEPEKVTASMRTSYGEVNLFFIFVPAFNLLSVHAVFDISFRSAPLEKIAELFLRANSSVLIGHFELGAGGVFPLWRCSLPIGAGESPHLSRQFAEVVDHMTDICEKYFPAFQHFIVGGLSPKEALAARPAGTAGGDQLENSSDSSDS